MIIPGPHTELRLRSRLCRPAVRAGPTTANGAAYTRDPPAAPEDLDATVVQDNAIPALVDLDDEAGGAPELLLPAPLALPAPAGLPALNIADPPNPPFPGLVIIHDPAAPHINDTILTAIQDDFHLADPGDLANNFVALHAIGATTVAPGTFDGGGGGNGDAGGGGVTDPPSPPSIATPTNAVTAAAGSGADGGGGNGGIATG